MTKQLASFDIFDTVLTRSVGEPTSLFLLLGRRLAGMRLIHATPEVFARLRVEAEKQSRRRAAGMETTFDRIHDELAGSLALTAGQRDQIMTEELRLEHELLRVVPEGRFRVEQARKAGAKVVFLSDMYLPRVTLVAMLQEHGLWREGDDCLVSGEFQMTKASGALFRELQRRENVACGAVTHVGNHPIADVEQPRSQGIRTSPYLRANLNRFERILESCACETEGLSSALAGASRHARLGVAVENDHQAQIRDVAASVAGPVLVGYVLWVLRCARDEGVRRLYFVSRDGQILLEVARRLVGKLGISCELRYLYGGRQAWHLPSLTRLGEEEFAWIFEDATVVSVRGQLARVGLVPEDWKTALNAIGLPERVWSDNLPTESRQQLRALLLTPDLSAAILGAAAEKRRLLLDYLRQEGIFSEGIWGVVDLGWRGRLLNSLTGLVEAAGGSAPVGFYFGLTGAVNRAGGPRFAYLFDRGRQTGYVREAADIPQPLEMFCAADHAVVQGYEQEGGRIRPKFHEARNASVENWGLSVMQRTIQAFADGLLLDGELVNPWADTRQGALAVLGEFWQRPTSAEATAWGCFPFEDDQNGESRRPAAEPYCLSDLAPALWRGTILPKRPMFWAAGGLALTSSAVRLAFRLGFGLRSTLGWARRAGTRLRGGLLQR